MELCIAVSLLWIEADVLCRCKGSTVLKVEAVLMLISIRKLGLRAIFECRVEYCGALLFIGFLDCAAMIAASTDLLVHSRSLAGLAVSAGGCLGADILLSS